MRSNQQSPLQHNYNHPRAPGDAQLRRQGSQIKIQTPNDRLGVMNKVIVQQRQEAPSFQSPRYKAASDGMNNHSPHSTQNNPPRSNKPNDTMTIDNFANQDLPKLFLQLCLKQLLPNFKSSNPQNNQIVQYSFQKCLQMTKGGRSLFLDDERLEQMMNKLPEQQKIGLITKMKQYTKIIDLIASIRRVIDEEYRIRNISSVETTCLRQILAIINDIQRCRIDQIYRYYPFAEQIINILNHCTPNSVENANKNINNSQSIPHQQPQHLHQQLPQHLPQHLHPHHQQLQQLQQIQHPQQYQHHQQHPNPNQLPHQQHQHQQHQNPHQQPQHQSDNPFKKLMKDPIPPKVDLTISSIQLQRQFLEQNIVKMREFNQYIQKLYQNKQKERKEYFFHDVFIGTENIGSIDDFLHIKSSKRDDYSIPLIVKVEVRNKHRKKESISTLPLSTNGKYRKDHKRPPEISEFVAQQPKFKKSKQEIVYRKVTFFFKFYWEDFMNDGTTLLHLHKTIKGQYFISKNIDKITLTKISDLLIKIEYPDEMKKSKSIIHKAPSFEDDTNDLVMVSEIILKRLRLPEGYSYRGTFKDNMAKDLIILNQHGFVHWDGEIDVSRIDQKCILINEHQVECNCLDLNSKASVTFLELSHPIQTLEKSNSRQKAQQKMAKFIKKNYEGCHLERINWECKSYTIGFDYFMNEEQAEQFATNQDEQSLPQISQLTKLKHELQQIKTQCGLKDIFKIGQI